MDIRSTARTRPLRGATAALRAATALALSLGLAGTVVRAQRGAMALLLDAPAPGTAFIAAEAHGEGCGISVWSYLYGPEARDLVARDLPRWQAWLGEFAGT